MELSDNFFDSNEISGGKVLRHDENVESRNLLLVFIPPLIGREGARKSFFLFCMKKCTFTNALKS